MKNIIDLTHTLVSSVPTWEGSCGFQLATVYNYTDSLEETSFKVQTVEMNCGIGTHIDAPAHCFKDGLTIDDLHLNDLINPGIMINISTRFDPDNCLTREDIVKFEAIHGRIQPGTCVLIHTGWENRWHTPDIYHNNYRFPYVTQEAAQLLVDRKVNAVGIDTLSPDRPDSGFPVHHLLLKHEIIIIENITNAGKLPSAGFTVTIAPLKMERATESPVRMWAIY